MEFDTAKLIICAVFGICAGGICVSVTRMEIRQNAFLTVLLSLAAALPGAFFISASYPITAAVLMCVLLKRKASFCDAAAVSLLSVITAFVIISFANALTASSLEAYSYTLRNEFYYSAVHNPFIIALILAAAIVFIPLIIWLCRSREKISSSLAMYVISLSLSAAVIMVAHMCASRFIDYKAHIFRLPPNYCILTGSISLVTMLLSCIFMRALRRRLVIPVRLGETKEFYFILAAIICTVVFYCYENSILNNYTSFEHPNYRYTISILTVLMIITIFTALISVCSYIFRTRAKQADLEHEMEITSMYRSEIRDIQREIFDFKHDYLKIYSSMSTYIINKDYDKLSDFFNSNITPLQKELFDIDADSRSLTLIEDGAVQGLLYSYMIKAKKAGVALITDIRENIPQGSIPVIDLNRLLGIFLDNAIEQAALNDKEVCFGAILKNDCIVYIIANSSDPMDIEKIFKRGESSKGSERGRGLAIARKLCAAHDELSLNTYFKNGKFVCEIYLDTEPPVN